jgi:ABC-type amino acid transport substrate-binding protein
MTPTLNVGAAFPDPPFNGADDDGGLDISMMQAIGEVLGMTVRFVPYRGVDFNGIFGALNDGDYDCVTAGTTVTQSRERVAAFCEPYLVSECSRVTRVSRSPNPLSHRARRRQ